VEAKWSAFADLTLKERFILFPAVTVMFLVGLYPQLILQFINPTVLQMVEGLAL
jgi:NADH-quinone oxidoreductase subunit M